MNKRHYEHTLPNIRGSLSNTYASTMILRPICVMALSILPLFLMRFAVGILHPNSRAMPPIPYTYFLSLSAAGCTVLTSFSCKAWRFRSINSSPVICHTGFDNRFFTSIFLIRLSLHCKPCAWAFYLVRTVQSYFRVRVVRMWIARFEYHAILLNISK